MQRDNREVESQSRAMRRVLRWLALLVSLTVATGARAQVPPGVVPPRLVSEPATTYPAGVSREATVVLTLTVGKDGAVESAVPAAADEPFSSAAAAAALAWRFVPATRDGAPVAAKCSTDAPSSSATRTPNRTTGWW
jgi:hypothetical protein